MLCPLNEKSYHIPSNKWPSFLNEEHLLSLFQHPSEMSHDVTDQEFPIREQSLQYWKPRSALIKHPIQLWSIRYFQTDTERNSYFHHLINIVSFHNDMRKALWWENLLIWHLWLSIDDCSTLMLDRRVIGDSDVAKLLFFPFCERITKRNTFNVCFCIKEWILSVYCIWKPAKNISFS